MKISVVFFILLVLFIFLSETVIEEMVGRYRGKEIVDSDSLITVEK